MMIDKIENNELLSDYTKLVHDNGFSDHVLMLAMLIIGLGSSLHFGIYL